MTLGGAAGFTVLVQQSPLCEGVVIGSPATRLVGDVGVCDGVDAVIEKATIDGDVVVDDGAGTVIVKSDVKFLNGHGVVTQDIETACNEILVHDQILVALVHLDGRTNVAGLTRILQAAAQTGRPVVTIVLCDHEHPEQALALTRLGVAECLSRPVDLSRLSYLIDALTIEAACSTKIRAWACELATETA